MACRLFDTKLIILSYNGWLVFGLLGTNFSIVQIYWFFLMKWTRKYHLQSGDHFVSALMCKIIIILPGLVSCLSENWVAIGTENGLSSIHIVANKMSMVWLYCIHVFLGFFKFQNFISHMLSRPLLTFVLLMCILWWKKLAFCLKQALRIHMRYTTMARILQSRCHFNLRQSS